MMAIHPPKVMVVVVDRVKVELDLLVLVVDSIMQTPLIVLLDLVQMFIRAEPQQILELVVNQVVDLVRQVETITKDLVRVARQDMQCLHQQNHKFF